MMRWRFSIAYGYAKVRMLRLISFRPCVCKHIDHLICQQVRTSECEHRVESSLVTDFHECYAQYVIGTREYSKKFKS
jgi:hypothetical protein